MLKQIIPLAMTAAIASSPTHADVLDYGKAFFFAPQSSVNRLFIEITGRLRFGNDADQKEYYLLYTHPREDTFREDGKIYTSKTAQSGGASTITFIIGKGGDAVFSRRYESPPWFSSSPHHCGPTPYSGGQPTQGSQIPLSDLDELRSFEDILKAAYAGAQIIGLAAYKTGDGTPVQIDFPVTVLNINPKTLTEQDVPPGQQWQIASAGIPLYIDGEDDCERIRNGHVAFSNFEGNLEFVYLCQSGLLWRTVDMNCVATYPGTVRLFTRRPRPK